MTNNGLDGLERGNISPQIRYYHFPNLPYSKGAAAAPFKSPMTLHFKHTWAKPGLLHKHLCKHNAAKLKQKEIGQPVIKLTVLHSIRTF